MREEIISQVRIRENGELILKLESGGRPSYQHVYREAKEVYWDEESKGFKSPKPRDWSYADWYIHIVKVARDINIELQLTENTDWSNVPSEVKKGINEAEVT